MQPLSVSPRWIRIKFMREALLCWGHHIEAGWVRRLCRSGIIMRSRLIRGLVVVPVAPHKETGLIRRLCRSGTPIRGQVGKKALPLRYPHKEQVGKKALPVPVPPIKERVGKKALPFQYYHEEQDGRRRLCRSRTTVRRQADKRALAFRVPPIKEQVGKKVGVFPVITMRCTRRCMRFNPCRASWYRIYVHIKDFAISRLWEYRV